MKQTKKILPEYRGFTFWLTELFPGYGNESSKSYAYQLQSPDHVEGGGAYATKHEATKAAFARIENLTFDR
jgi:hypothetical protein